MPHIYIYFFKDGGKMDFRMMKAQLRDALLKLPKARMINNKELVMRCPICGDSKKDPNKTRFYIKIDIDSDEPILYHCFNGECGASGLLNPSILRSMNIHNLQLNSGLHHYNNKAVRKLNKSLGIKNKVFDFHIPTPPNNKYTEHKLNYVKERLGINFTIEELVDLRTVFFLNQFLKENEIEVITVDKERANFLNNVYIGFLSTYNEFINFRDTTGKYKRWIKYTIYKNLDNTKKFYTIPNNINLLTTKTITINIAEGVFDILGVYYHIFDKEKENMIYVASCDSDFTSVVKHFIQMGVFGNVRVNIFSDSDHNIDFYKTFVNNIKDFVNEIFIYYNELEKDYGVKKNNIKLIKKKLM